MTAGIVGAKLGYRMPLRLETPDVRRHLRQFLEAQLSDGRAVLFRLYDPGVWRTYLPTCE